MIHSFNVPRQGFLCQFQFLEFTPLCYEQQKWFSIHRHSPSALSVLWYWPGIRRPGETKSSIQNTLSVYLWCIFFKCYALS